jgi:hypothetical protein
VGWSTYGLAPPPLFPYLLVTARIAIVEIGRDVPIQNVIVRIADTTTTVAKGMFMMEG